MQRMTRYASLMLVGVLFSGYAWGGPIIIDGTDSDDHGFFSSGANQTGWLYIEDGFDNLGPQVGNGNKLAVCLGCNSSQGLGGFTSGFDQSNLVGGGWTRATVTGATAINDFFNNTGAVKLQDTGILYLPTDAFQTSGGITDAELQAVNAHAADINAFVSGPGDPTLGGGLFAHSEVNSSIGFGWLSTLLPGLVANGDCNATFNCDDGTLSLTAAGSTAFPDLTNAILSNATPWHGWFTGNLGGLQVLATGIIDSSTQTSAPVIIGGGAGTTITPNNSVPEPATLGLLALGLLLMAESAGLRRKLS